MRESDFVNHEYDYKLNWTPLSPITIPPIALEEIAAVMTEKIYHKILKNVLPRVQISFTILRRELCLILFSVFANNNLISQSKISGVRRTENI